MSCGQCRQRLDVKRLVRQQLFQPPVFVFQLTELLHITDFGAGIFRSPLIKRGIRDAMLAAELLDPNARLGVLEAAMICSSVCRFRVMTPPVGPISAQWHFQANSLVLGRSLLMTSRYVYRHPPTVLLIFQYLLGLVGQDWTWLYCYRHIPIVIFQYVRNIINNCD